MELTLTPRDPKYHSGLLVKIGVYGGQVNDGSLAQVHGVDVGGDVGGRVMGNGNCGAIKDPEKKKHSRNQKKGRKILLEGNGS